MAIRTESVSLDVRPCCTTKPPVVCGRKGDEGAVLEVTVTRDGSPMDLSGLTATLMGNNPDYLQAAGAVSGSKVSFTLASAFFSSVRSFPLYVQLKQGSSVVASTQAVELRVAPGADVSAAQAAPYVSVLDELAERAEGLADDLAATIASADITVSAARLDPGSEPTATVTGSGLSKHVELGIPSATAGVSCEAGPAEMVTVHGAAEDAPLAERVADLERKVAALEAAATPEPGPDEPEVPAEEWPEYSQPQGAHDAYMAGDRVTWHGVRYECLSDGCVWSPTDYPAAWREVVDADN